MTSSNGTRLVQAVSLYLLHRQSLDADTEFLSRHPELNDLLVPMLQQVRPEFATSLDDFKLLRELGAGGMGVVYEAMQLSVARRVAVKVLLPKWVGAPTAVARFRREARALSGLNHRGIVQIFAIGGEDHHPWLAMELIDGKPLDRAGITGEALLRLMVGVAQALEHAHGIGVVHRDIKPSNILVRSDGQPALTDFGLARSDDLPRLTLTGAFAGTPAFASPEQARGQPVDGRSDVFSLGVTLYSQLTGRLPFQRESDAATLAAVREQEPCDPRRLAPDIPADLAAIVLKAMNKDPAGRYATAGEFAQDLQRHLAHEPVAARLPGPLGRMWRWLRRERAAAALLFGSLLVVPTIAAVVGVWAANVPVVRVAEQNQRQRALEERSAHAVYEFIHGSWQSVLELTSESKLGHGTREDCVMHWLALVRSKGKEAALTAMDRCEFEHEAMRELLQRLLGDSTKPQPRQEVGLPGFAQALSAFADLVKPDRNLPEHRIRPALVQYQQLSDRLAIISRCSVTPRLPYYLAWAEAAAIAQDQVACAMCAEVIDELWPGSIAVQPALAAVISSSNPQRALQLLQDYTREKPNSEQGWSSLASACLQQGQAELALQATTKLVAMRPGSWRAHRLHGQANSKAGSVTQATLAMQQVITLDPSGWLGHCDLARWHDTRGEVQLARDHWQLAIAADCPLPEAYLRLAAAKAGEDREAARALFSQAVAKDPAARESHDRLVECAAQAGLADLEIDELRRWARLKSDANSQLSLARALLDPRLTHRAEDADASLLAILRCLTADDASARHWVEAATVLQQRGCATAAQELRRIGTGVVERK